MGCNSRGQLRQLAAAGTAAAAEMGVAAAWIAEGSSSRGRTAKKVEQSVRSCCRMLPGRSVLAMNQTSVQCAAAAFSARVEY